MTAEERARGIAPDRVSDVAEWGDRPIHGKDFRDMTPEELDAAEKLAVEIQQLRRSADDDD
jgi:hypothetical protein